MKLRSEHVFLIQTSLIFVLLLALIVQTGRLLGDWGMGRFDLVGSDTATLSADTETYLSNLDTPLSLTYFATPRQTMPAHLKGVEKPIHDFLSRLKSIAPNRIDYRVIDPDLSGASYASRKKASPFTVRNIERDEQTEQTVWSSLVVGYGSYPEILIQKITPSDLPHLERLIIDNLKALKNPPKPVIAVSAPQQFSLFSSFLGQWGEVRKIDLSNPNAIPPEADVIFWLDPTVATQNHIRALQNAIDRGRTVVLAGSPYVIDYTANEQGSIQYRAYGLGSAWETLLTPLGIRPRPDLLMDQSNGPIFFRDQKNKIHQVEAPFHLRIMPGFYDLKGFLSPARGALNFVSAGPLESDPRKVSDAGYYLDILGTTTDNAYVQILPEEDFTNEHINQSLKIGKQNVMLSLRHKNPWKGEFLILATSSLFRDGIFNQPNYAHRVFLQTVMRTFTESNRIVRGKVERATPPPIPELSATARIFWRGVVIIIAPLILVILGARRYFVISGAWTIFRGFGGLPIHAGLALIGLFIASYIWSLQGGKLLDLTEEHVHTLLPLSHTQFAKQNFKADFILPSRSHLPPTLKGIESLVVSRLNDLDISYTIRRPDNLSTTDHARLNALGLRPFEMRTVRDDAETSQHVLSGLVLHRPGGSTVIPRVDDKTADHLEFLLATAAQRLSTGKTPHIALVSEPPRLSPAEAFEYHQKQLSPPKGADVFSELKTLLRTYGYRVTYINPGAPHLPPDTDLLIWMQPRRDASKMTALLSQHLARGGKAIVAMQHYNIQQRQYRGGGFETVYWPQPQYQDLNQYLEPLGIGQVREILMDQTRSRLALETQIYRRAVREYEAQEVALPFLIRTVAPNFESNTPITRQLGDQLFIWGNRFMPVLDSLRTHSLTTSSLITTSGRAWAYDWSGGWLPESAFAPDSLILSKQPLVVLVSGTFPTAEFRIAETGESERILQHPTPNPSGQLLLIGSSEMFKNTYLYTPGFQHEQFLLNAVAYLTHGPEFSELQARRKIARGFPYQPPGLKTLWRILVVGLGPFCILVYGLVRYLKERKT